MKVAVERKWRLMLENNVTTYMDETLDILITILRACISAKDACECHWGQYHDVLKATSRCRCQMQQRSPSELELPAESVPNRCIFSRVSPCLETRSREMWSFRKLWLASMLSMEKKVCGETAKCVVWFHQCRCGSRPRFRSVSRSWGGEIQIDQ